MSSNSNIVSLPEICELVTDGTHDSPKLQPFGVPFIKGKHISSGRIDFEGSDFITEEDHLRCVKRVKPQIDDVLFSNIGSVGDAARVTNSIEFSIKNVALFRPDPHIIDPLYFYYLVISPNFRSHFLNVRSGAAQPFISLKSFRSLKFKCLKYRKSQERIGQILSAYDDLIENNRRRIQLLEQAARLLYKEWFVYLRFPGHEHVKIKDGVPEGWEKKTVGESAPFHYGKALKKENRIPGSFPVYGSSGIIGNHEKALVKGPAIIVGRKGNVGSIFWSDSHFYPIDTVYFIEPQQCSIYLYYALLNTQFISTDVAVPGLNRDFAHSRKIVIPEKKIFAQFEQDVGLIRTQINTLYRYNENLAHARACLLPRLMNGEIVL